METSTAILLGAVITNSVVVVMSLISLSRKWGRLENKVESTENAVKEYKGFDGRISAIEGFLRMTKGGLIRGSSPLNLTDKGTALLEESGAKEYIEKNKESLLKQFEDMTIPYDIQKKAGEVMSEELEKDEGVKEFVFRKGEFMKDVADVAGIALRDVVLEHKGIEVNSE